MYQEIEELLFLSKRGDVRAKEKLLLKLNPLIISSIRKYYNRLDQYDDLIQEGYKTILLAFEEYDPTKGVKFLGYVKTMLKYNYLEKYKERQHLSLNSQMGDGEFIDFLEGFEKDPMDVALKKEESEILLKGLKELTKRQRQVVVDYYINGLSIQEIAHKLNISYRTVVNIKTQGLSKLKKIIVK